MSIMGFTVSTKKGRRLFLDKHRRLCKPDPWVGKSIKQLVDIREVYYEVGVNYRRGDIEVTEHHPDGKSEVHSNHYDVISLLANLSKDVIAWVSLPTMNDENEIMWFLEYDQCRALQIIIDRYRLKDMFLNMPESFIRDVALCLKDKEYKFPIYRNVEPLCAQWQVLRREYMMKRFNYHDCNDRLINVLRAPSAYKKVTRCQGIPKSLPLVYYISNTRWQIKHHVFSEIVLNYKDGTQDVLSLKDYISQLDLKNQDGYVIGIDMRLAVDDLKSVIWYVVGCASAKLDQRPCGMNIFHYHE